MRSRVVLEQRREPAADAEVDARPRIGGVHAVHVVALLARHHLERELVVVAQEDRPLAVGRDVGRLREDLDDRVAVFLRDRHVHARHQREVVGHLAFVAVAEVLAHVFRPHGWPRPAAAGPGTSRRRGADRLDDGVRLAQVLVARAVALDEVRNGVEAEAVDAHLEPESITLSTASSTAGLSKFRSGWWLKKRCQKYCLGDLVPGPVGLLGVGEDDARAAVQFWGRRSRRRSRARANPVGARRAAWNQGCWSDVWLTTSSVITRRPRRAPRRRRRGSRRACRSGWTSVVVGDVVAVVAQRRGVEGQQPDRVDAERLHVVELLGQAAEVADAVAVGVGEGLDVQLVDDGVLVPERVVRRDRGLPAATPDTSSSVTALKGPDPLSEEIVEVVLACASAPAVASRAPGTCVGSRLT